MFILDTIALSPAKGILWIAGKILAAVADEEKDELQEIKTKLSQLYMMLETGQLSEDEFDAQEGPLLDRLDDLQAAAEDPDNPEGQGAFDSAESKDET